MIPTCKFYSWKKPILRRNRKVGFTVAEILVTLVVVGVVASLTIPVLIQNTQNAQYRTSIKELYADINQAAIRVMSNTMDLSNLGTSNDLKNQFQNYMSYSISCNSGSAIPNQQKV